MQLKQVAWGSFWQVNLPLHICYADTRTAWYQLLLVGQVVEYL